MATKSILKSVRVRSNDSAKKLVSALENSKRKNSRVVIQSKAYKHAGRDDIQKMFATKSK